MEFLVPEMQVLLWTIFVFLCLVGLLWKFAWGPLMKALEEREHRIAQRIKEAEELQAQAKAKLAEYEQRLATVEAKAEEFMAKAKRDAQTVRAQIAAEELADAERFIEKAKREIALAKDAALQEVREQAVAMASRMAQQVIRREVKAEDHRRFIQDALVNVEKSVQ